MSLAEVHAALARVGCNVTERTLRRYCANGDLRAVPRGRSWAVRPADLASFCTSHGLAAPPVAVPAALTIAEASRATGLPERTLRLWCAEGRIPGASWRASGYSIPASEVPRLRADAGRRDRGRVVVQGIAAEEAVERVSADTGCEGDGDELPTARGFLLGPDAAEAIGDLEQLAALAPVFDGHGLPIGISEPENGSTRRGPPRFASAEEQGAHHRLHRAASALRALERLDPHTAEALWLAFVACGPTVRARLDGAATDAHGGPGGFSGAAAVALLGAAGDGAELRRRGDELLAGALVAFLYARASDVPPVHRLDTAALRRRSDDLRGALMRHGTRAPGGVSAGRQ